MLKLLILILIIGGIFYIYRRIKASQATPPPPQQPQRSTHAVKCELCGLHVPEHEAVRRDNHLYCCQDHADKAARQ